LLTFSIDEDVFGLEITVVDIFALQIGAALGKLKEEGKCLLLWDVTMHNQVTFEIASWRRKYPPEQNSRKK
jgi:hypothetical protein